MSERPIYVAIMDAYERRRGIRLSAAEVRMLGRDDIIVSRAATCLPDDNDHLEANFTWCKAYHELLRSATPEANDHG